MTNPSDPWAQNSPAGDAAQPVPPANPYGTTPAYPGGATTPEVPAAPAYGTAVTPPAAPAYGEPAAPAYAETAPPAYGQQPAPGYAAAPAYAAPAYPQNGAAYGAYAAPKKTNTMAIVSIIATAASLITGISAIVGIICGHIALSQIKRTGENGRGLALTGVIGGYVMVGITILLTVLMIVFFVAAASAGYSSYDY